MATQGAVRLIGGTGAGGWSKGFSAFDSSLGNLPGGEGLGFVDNGSGFYGGWRESVPDRSGSAPPSMEGSLAALGNLIGQQSGNFDSSLSNLDNVTGSSTSEEQLRADPAYFDYYGSKVNLNPRLPPPIVSRESRRFMNRVGKVKEWRVVSQGDSNKGSVFVPRSTLSTHKEEPEDDKSPTLDSSSADDAQTNLMDFVPQEKRNIRMEPGNDVLVSETVVAELDAVDSSMKNLKLSLDTHSTSPVKQQWQGNFSPLVQSDHIQMTPHGTHLPHVPFVDNLSHTQLKLSTGNMQQLLPQPGMTTPFYEPNSFGSPYYQNLHPASVLPTPYGTAGYALGGPGLPPFMTSYSPQSSVATPLDSIVNPSFSGRPSGFPSAGNLTAGSEFVQPYKMYGQLGYAMQPPIPDPNFFPFFQHPSFPQYASGNHYSTLAPRGSVFGNVADNFDPQKVFPQAQYLSDQRLELPKTGISNSPTALRGGTVPNYHGISPYVGVPLTYPTSPVFQGQPFPGISPSGRRNDSARFQSASRDMTAISGIQGQRERGKFDNPKTCTFLEELKSNRARRVELSDITGCIVEFSADQHGSRFIQQKLENCTAEEKASVFAEVLPHAPSLMTDVFGNYVIQKFFEHGTPEQRRGLATKLAGHVLPLSLQMYGCRVIQKALEVMELDQKIDLVHELDGNIMRCVRDQNGNHVIQKCIECVPTEHIGFVVSAFRGQVASLSMHPYGCRVIQRILEHCGCDSQGQCIIDEILQSACILAQDQYGNYVTQHVLEKGKSNERAEIISKLAGQVITMSQNKFASNVIEKCFQHGDIAERDLLIREIVEQTDGNDSLLAMMKDQYANYVVQKILETCNDQQRELLVSRVKGHLQALRKYTYGKHIASRVEQLCDEGGAEPDS
ncbi:unnamed protein product [Alopecurus aequalis]